jgi:hypothetical protein
MMTDEQILKLVQEHFEEWEADEDGYCWVEFAGKPDAYVKFAQEIRKQTIDEILTLLKEVPNPEANRTAINRIMSI